jgi:serine/threonine protein kinase/predicted negative regulator of RcsB-dependent stress response
MNLAAGMVVASRFAVEAFASRGGMGAVFRARDLESGKLVALKLMQPSGVRGDSPTMASVEGVEKSGVVTSILSPNDDTDSPEGQRFLREARVLADLHHPGIVSYVAHGVMDDGVPFLVMEWLTGKDLAQVLKEQSLTPAESIELIRSVAEALALAHRHGVIHRDIKPSNLFLRQGRAEGATLMDFGIARWLSAEQPELITHTGAVVGTPEYMAPEQARGAKELTAAADIFSLGCVLFECLTQKPPFMAQHIAAVLAKILFEEAPALRSVRPEMPEALERLLARMLAKDPASRLEDADALLVALNELGDLADLSAPELVSRTSRRPLISREQALVSVIIASDCVSSPTLVAISADELLAESDRIDTLRTGLTLFGARLERLADGSMVATLPYGGRGAATDLAAQAARCALYLKERWPEAKVVLATGRGVVGSGPPMGEALDKAARLLRFHGGASSSPGSSRKEAVWMDDVTAGLLGTSFREQRVAAHVHVLYGEQLDTDESRLLLGKPTPCVGREHELSVLESALAYVTDESTPRALLLVSQPGMGKSRLRHEFLRRLGARGADVEVLLGRGDPMSAGASFGLLSRAIRRLSGVLDGDPPEAQRQRLTDRVARHVQPADAPRVAAFIGELCGVPFPADENVQLRAARNDPKLMNDHISRAFIDFMRGESSARPVVLVLEDLHWGDASTVKLINTALRELSDAPLLVLALARPEVKELFPGLWAGRVQEVLLSRLSRKACERLAREVLAEKLSPSALQRIVAQSTGNALFLEELLRSVAEGNEELPETVLAMLQARVARLEPGARRVLRAASVFGETFWKNGVITLLDEDGEDVMVTSWLQHLVENEVIQVHPESRFPSETEYGFRHALVRDAAYSLLTDADRALGHCLVGKYLQAVGESEPLVLAEHFQRGGDGPSAVPYFVRAAIQALGGSDLEGALDRVKRGVACGAEGEHLGTLRAVEAWAQFWRANLAAAFPVGCEAVRLLPAGSYHWCRAMGNAFMTGGLIGKLGELGPMIQDFAATRPEPEARTAYIEGAALLATVFSLTGQRQKAYTFLNLTDEMGKLVPENDATARGWIRHGHNWHIRFLEPEPWRAFRMATEATQAFEEAGDQRMFAVDLVYLGIAQWDLGDMAKGEATLRAAMAAGERLNETLVLRLARIYIALLLMERGGEAVLDEVHDLAAVVVKGSPNTYYAGLAHCAVAQELATRGELERAEAEARTALATLKVAPPLKPLGYAVLGQVLIAQGRAAEARAVTDEGLSLVASLGGAGRKEMKLWRVAAQACLSAGDEEAGRRVLRDARAALDLRASTIPDPEVRRRFLSHVPDHARIVELCDRLLSAAAQ